MEMLSTNVEIHICYLETDFPYIEKIICRRYKIQGVAGNTSTSIY